MWDRAQLQNPATDISTNRCQQYRGTHPTEIKHDTMDIAHPDRLVERIMKLWDDGMKDESKLVETLTTEFQITTDDAEWALELTQTGLFRANIISSGQKYPKSNLTDEPILKSALKAGLNKLGRPELYEIAVRQDRPWWKIW